MLWKNNEIEQDKENKERQWAESGGHGNQSFNKMIRYV